LSTDALPEVDRVAVWREEFGRFVFRLEVEPIGDQPFRADTKLSSLPGLNLMSGVCSSVRYRATTSHVADHDDCVGLIINGDTAIASQLGRETALPANVATVISWTDPLTFILPSGAGSGSLARLSRPVLQALVPNLSDWYLRPIPGDGDAMKLLFSYLKVLQDQQAVAGSELQHKVVTHIYDLAALALGASRDAAEVAKERSLQVARLRTIKEDIRARLAEPGLSLTAVARSHGVSPRYVQKLFHSEGTSFSDFVRTGRLDQIYRLLQDPRLMDRSIATIAYLCGFGDIASFNRAFRRHYGAAPSDIRAAGKNRRA
jgi:AraC-like DNA-binding protein